MGMHGMRAEALVEERSLKYSGNLNWLSVCFIENQCITMSGYHSAICKCC